VGVTLSGRALLEEIFGETSKGTPLSLGEALVEIYEPGLSHTPRGVAMTVGLDVLPSLPAAFLNPRNATSVALAAERTSAALSLERAATATPVVRGAQPALEMLEQAAELSRLPMDEGLVPLEHLEEVLRARSLELDDFVKSKYPGRAGGHYTFGVGSQLDDPGRVYVSLNHALEGVPVADYVQRGILKPGEVLVLNMSPLRLSQAERAASALKHGPAHAENLLQGVNVFGRWMIGASRRICPQCAAMLWRHRYHNVVPFRNLGPKNLAIFLERLGVPAEHIGKLTPSRADELRRMYFPHYRSGGRDFRPFRR
jgi:hypothetical protein